MRVTLAGVEVGLDRHVGLLEVTLIAHGDPAVSCDYDDCVAAAAWSFRCDGCADVTLLCTPHRLLADGNNYAHRVHWLVPACRYCHQPYPVPMPWLPL